MSAANPKYTSVDEYINSFPENFQEVLNKFRKIIKEC